MVYTTIFNYINMTKNIIDFTSFVKYAGHVTSKGAE